MSKQDEFRRIISMPSDEDKDRCDTIAYVGSDMIANRATVNVRCNCGASVPYDTSIGTNVAQCDACGKVIGLISVEGGPGAIEYTRPDGTKGAVPVQGYD